MKPAKIKCLNCGYESNIISDTCIKCGGPLVKICGKCGANNPVENNYCEKCGALLALKIIEEKEEKKEEEPKEIKKGNNIEFENINETVSDKESSYRKKIEEEKNKKIEDKRILETEIEKKKIEEFAKKKEENNKNNSVIKKVKKNKNIYFLVASIFALIFVLYILISPKIPKIRLMLTAKKYLTDLKEKRYIEAYSYLSTNSKTSCPFTEYLKYNEEYYGKIKKWDFKDLKIFFIDNNGAVIKYMLKEDTAPWREDYISFVLEHNLWRRPYIYNFFAPIDENIMKGDYPQALFDAQKLYLTDPIDPRTSGYLCNCEYLMGLYDKSAQSCKRTLDNQKIYPVGFTEDEIFWFAFYYADSLRFLAKFKEALKIYDELISYKDIGLKNKCPLFMSRADIYVRLKDYSNADNDIDSAIDVCSEGVNKKEAVLRARYLNGSAKEEAINLAKRYRPKNNGPTILEIRASQVLSTENKNLNKKYKIKDIWKSEHLNGPEYIVYLIQEKTLRKNNKKEERNIYVFKVNLWTGTVNINED